MPEQKCDSQSGDGQTWGSVTKQKIINPHRHHDQRKILCWAQWWRVRSVMKCEVKVNGKDPDAQWSDVKRGFNRARQKSWSTHRQRLEAMLSKVQKHKARE